LAHAFRNEDGQASVEYALLAALVSIAAISLMAALGLEVKGLFKAFLDVFP
jgi:Flp pilus assembly pilin Flp